ncbi:ATP-binding cassette domain-containing protein [Streptomyces meridianus]|uniref:ABC transporter ATP-binding protein n=1 Tax=Streptomyces meridianus TaxID=2938945 RepID=A0ABT0X8H7_9ACTN|nr:ABC transporter ATP-binding protein [Streptomyces meridianus]MCM2578827.1 ABC transporter ATP-binding protein [Streptomyces meridianus]
MIQAIGLTSTSRRSRPSCVDDLTLEARSGNITVLLGARGAGKSTAMRLMLHLEPGRGITLFRGRPLHRISHPAHEVGAVLGDVPGHPGRTARNHLRMVGAAVGAHPGRVDDVLELVGLTDASDSRLGSLSVGMDRRLGLAVALLADPHSLVLDEPARGLSSREAVWLHRLLRGFAGQGGTVLLASRDPREAARIADRVVTLEAGRVVADQSVADFAARRLRPRVSVRSPHAARLASLVDAERRAAGSPVEVVRESGNRIAVYGSTCAAVGETAFRNGILIHQLADEVFDAGPTPARERTSGRRSGGNGGPEAGDASGADAAGHTSRPRLSAVDTGPSIEPRSPSSPVWPLRYELIRATGVRAGLLLAAVSMGVSLVAALLLGLIGEGPAPRVFAGWLPELPLPPAAVASGIFGALSFGQEFRYPALGFVHGPVPRRLALLTAKLVVTAAFAVALSLATLALNMAVVRLLFGSAPLRLPAGGIVQTVGWAGIVMACGWAGVIAAGLLRSTAAGVAVVLGIPLVVVPGLRMLADGGEGTGSLPGPVDGLQTASLFHGVSADGRWTATVNDLLAWSVLGTGAGLLGVSASLLLIGLLRGRVR